jgi:hypothetical protein
MSSIVGKTVARSIPTTASSAKAVCRFEWVAVKDEEEGIRL